MKKLFVALLLFLIATPLYASNTLYEYYVQKGSNLPSLNNRAIIYQSIANDAYTGSYEQNLALLSYLEDGVLGANVPASAVNWTLASPHTSSATTIDVSNFKDLRDNAIATTSMPTKVYLVIEPENTTNTEIVMCLSANGDETNTQFTGCTRGLAFSGTSETAVTANQKSHPSGASVIMTNVGQFFNNFVDTDSAQTIAGIKTFSSSPVLPSTDPTTDYQAAPKVYVDNLANQGAATSTEGTAGIGQISTQAEQAGNTFDSNAPTFLSTKYASSTSANRHVVVSESDGKLNQGWLDLTEDYTFTGDVTIDNTLISSTSVFSRFAGDASDGDLTVSATTSLNTAYKIFNYDNLTINEGITLSFGANYQDKVVYIKVKNNLTINGILDLTGLGSVGGAGGAGGASDENSVNTLSTAGTNGSDNDEILDANSHLGVGGGIATDGWNSGSLATGGAAGVILTKTGIASIYVNQKQHTYYVVPGSGGAGGAGGSGARGSNNGTGGAGGAGGTIAAVAVNGSAGSNTSDAGGGGGAGGAGAGGGAIVITVGNNINFGANSSIKLDAQDGANGGTGGTNAAGNGGSGAGGGGGAGGAGGMGLILYNGSLTDSGVATSSSGGNGGTGGTGGVAGGVESSGNDGGHAGAGGGGGGFYVTAGGTGGTGGNGGIGGAVGGAPGAGGAGGAPGANNGSNGSNGSGNAQGGGGGGGAGGSNGILIIEKNYTF